jgi:hypothetical protein
VGKPQTFRSPVAVVVWVVWLLFAVANWIDLAVQGRDHTSAVAAAILLLATGVAYVTAQRPRVIADDAGVTIRNPLRDHRIRWAAVTRVDLADLLRVHCAWAAPDAPDAPDDPDGTAHRTVIRAWAVHISRRRQLAAEARAVRAARSRRSSVAVPSGGRGPAGGRGPSYGAPVTAATEAEAEKVARLLSDRAEAARPAAGASGPSASTPPASTPPASAWSVRAAAALIIPALILLLVWLL